MAKRRRIWVLIGIATTFTIIGGGFPAAAAPQPDLVDIGKSPAGVLSLDRGSIHDHRGRHSRGWRRALTSVQLADPIAEAGRMLGRVDQIQDWDCSGRRYRGVRQVFRTENEEYVRSEPMRGDWAPVLAGAAEARAFALICPAAAPSKEAITEPVLGSTGPKPPRRRSGAAVIWMPGARPDIPEDSDDRR